MSITIQLLELLGSRLQVESIYGKGCIKLLISYSTGTISILPESILEKSKISLIRDFESRVHQIAQDYNYNTKFYAPDAKILIVDDNIVNLKVLRNLLKALGNIFLIIFSSFSGTIGFDRKSSKPSDKYFSFAPDTAFAVNTTTGVFSHG